jgi:hypothetical protein
MKCPKHVFPVLAKLRLSSGDKPGLRKGPHCFQRLPLSVWLSCTLRSGRDFALGASKADIALSKHMLHLIGRPDLDFWQTLHSLQWERKLLQERNMSAELL